MPTDAANDSVLMVVHSTFPATGGAEIQAARLSHGLAERGWKVRVVALEGPVNTVQSSNGIPVTRLRRPRLPKIAGAVLALRFASLLIRERKSYKVIHVHIMKTLAFVAGVVGRWLDKKVVLKVSGYDELDHGALSEKNAHNPYYRLMNWGCRRADTIVAISQLTARKLRTAGYGEGQILCLPNGIDVQRFTPVADKQAQRRVLGIDATHMAVFVGRFTAEKGLFELLDAWVPVRKKFPGSILCLVGDGRLRPALETVVRADRSLAGAVHFAGETTKVADYLAAADCYVCSSRTEGLSNTMLEAMAAGLPVVSTRVSGAEDMVQDARNGYLVPIGEPEKLADGIINIFSDLEGARRMGQESRHTALETFDLARVIDRYEQLYRSN